MALTWGEHRLVFEVGGATLPVGGAGFAQGPQALVLEDRVRVYFSTRERDGEGLFRSHVCFVDLDRRLERVLGVADRPVLPLGALGTYDEHGVFPFHVFRWGERVVGLATGWTRRRSVPADAALIAAESVDGGRTFARWGPGPVLGPSLHEPFLVGDIFVRPTGGGGLRGWYIAGRRWVDGPDGAPPERVYRILSADTPDLRRWAREGVELIPPVLGEDECQAMPTVVRLGDRWHMFFCFRHAFGFRDDPSRGYRIGHAWSADGRRWIRDDAAGGFSRSGDAWDARMQCYPHLVEVDGEVWMLYNGDAFGKAGFGVARLLGARGGGA